MRLLGALLVGGAWSCSVPATQVLVYVDVEAGSEAATRAAALSVRVRDGAGQVVLEETRRLVGDAPLVTLPASISLVPAEGDARRTFEVEVALLEPGPSGPTPFLTQSAEGAFTADEVKEIRLRFEDACLGVTCGEGRSCLEGQCRRACYSPTAPGAVTRSEPGACPCRCTCEGDTCMDGDCVPRRVVQSITAGHAHACALGQEGEVWCWGANQEGQLGVGDLERHSTPVLLSLPPARAVAAGPDFSCVALQSGQVQCFGEGARGQLGPGATSASPRPVVLVDANQTPFEGAVTVSAGGVFGEAEPSAHACLIRGDGEAYCWGQNEFGQLGRGDTQSPGAPGRVMTSLAADGLLALDLGGFHSCARQRIGRLWCWGRNHDWQLGFADQQDRALPEQVRAEPGFDTVLAMTAGTWHGCAVSPDHGLYCFGEDAGWRLGLGQPDGSDGDDVMVPTQVLTSESWADVAAGHRHTCALTTQGTLWCFGTSSEGELGTQASFGAPASPPRPLREEPWRTVALGTSFTCGVRRGGALYCFGRNGEGQLGVGEGGPKARPARVCLP